MSEHAHLVSATIAARDSFLEAMTEFEEATGYTDAGDLTFGELQTPGVLERLISTLNHDANPVSSHPLRRAHWWWVETSTADSRTPVYLGRITLLFDPPLRRGHLELAVRPSRRRRGHGLAMIDAVRPIAEAWGISNPTLVTGTDNAPARRLIEAAGGVLDFEHPDDGLCKYHLDAVPSPV